MSESKKPPYGLSASEMRMYQNLARFSDVMFAVILIWIWTVVVPSTTGAGGFAILTALALWAWKRAGGTSCWTDRWHD